MNLKWLKPRSNLNQRSLNRLQHPQHLQHLQHLQNRHTTLLQSQQLVSWLWHSDCTTNMLLKVNANAKRLSPRLNAKRTVLSLKHKRPLAKPLLTLKNAKPYWNAKSKNCVDSNVIIVHASARSSKTSSRISIHRYESLTSPGQPEQTPLTSLMPLTMVGYFK